MADLIKLFKILKKFYDPTLSWESIDDIYEEHEQKLLENPHHICEIENLNVVSKARAEPLVLSTLLEICSSIKTLRKHSGSYDNTYDCWDRVIEVSPKDEYLSFIYALAGLGNLKPNSILHIRLSIAAAATYFLSITIPGAKGFHIFEEKVIEHTLKVFNFMDKWQNPNINNVLRNVSQQQQTQIWINFERFCDNFKLVFGMVQFDECKHLRDLILQKLVRFQYTNYELGYPNIYAANLHANIYGIFDSLVDKHHDDLNETILKIMKLTFNFHSFQPIPKKQTLFPWGSNNEVIQHISEWFIKMIEKYPSVLTTCLQFLIRCLITKTDGKFKSEQYQRFLDYAAKYDGALYSKCNESIIPFLEKSVFSDETVIRSRSINLLSRILTIESHVNWELCGELVSNVPREVYATKLLLDAFIDTNNANKHYVVQALINAFQKGNRNTIKILNESVKYSEFSNSSIKLPNEPPVTKNEIRYGKPPSVQAKFTFQGHELLRKSFNELPDNIYWLLKFPMAYLRRAALMLLEIIVKINPRIIFNTEFVKEISNLVNETTGVVRRQALLTIDSILSHYPNCFPAIYVWCKLLQEMLIDNDQKIVDLAINCFKTKVLDNIENIENSNKAEHFMPWVIVRTLLNTTQRLQLQCIFQKEFKKGFISQSIMTKIAKHTLTANSTEAWIVLNFVSGNVDPKEPDFLIQSFTTLNSWNHENNLFIIIEVLNNCVDKFTPSALNIAFNYILEKMKSGTCLYTCVGKIFDLLIKIHNQSVVKFNKGKDNLNKRESVKWQLDLYQFSYEKIIDNMDFFPGNRSAYLSYLYLYSELTVVLACKPHGRIISFAYSYVAQILNTPEDDIELENVRIINCMIQIAGRLAIHDRKCTDTIVLLCGNILTQFEKPPIVNTILVTLTDLAVRHTRSVESILSKILLKLKSKYIINRKGTFQNLQNLITRDQLKLRGNILISMLSTLVDPDDDLSNQACIFFSDYMTRKNPTLFQKCLYECPYSMNEYNYSDLEQSIEEFQSPLKGENCRKLRYLLYNQMINSCEEIQMLYYFENMIVLYGKVKKDDNIKSSEGIAMLKDFLYILKRISYIQSKTTHKNTRDVENIDEFDDIDESLGNTVSDDQKKSPCKKRRREGPTKFEALEMIEKTICIFPKMAHHLLEIDESFQIYIDKFCIAFCKGFTLIAANAQPANFWNKYRTSRIMKSTKGKSKGMIFDGETSDENDDANKSQENDDMMQLEANDSNHDRNCNDVLYDYLFCSV